MAHVAFLAVFLFLNLPENLKFVSYTISKSLYGINRP